MQYGLMNIDMIAWILFMGFMWIGVEIIFFRFMPVERESEISLKNNKGENIL